MHGSVLSRCVTLSASLGCSPLTWAANIQCQPEPGSDTFLQYGDTASCTFETTGDIDVYRFIGNAGDQPFIQIGAQGCRHDLYLYNAQGQLLGSDSGCNTASITNYALPEDGTYTILATTDVTSGIPLDYTLELPCVFGDCSISPPPKGLGLLGYVPVEPCRIVDTRLSISGDLQAGLPQSFLAYGSASELANQGGQANCPHPKEGQGLVPVAIAANVTAAGAFTSSFFGNIVAYPTGSTPPGSSLVNFVGGINIANSTVVKLCEAGCAAGDFDMRATTAVPAIVDVQGYFYEIP